MPIHELTATELSRHLASGELTSVAIVEALAKRRREVDSKLNAVILWRDEAMAEAKAADEARARGDALGPLHGLPITIKENLELAGTDTTLGLLARRGTPSPQNGVLVQQLRDKGAIILGKTNVPQLLLAQETENAIYGTTNNPWNTARVPGGSSGGESAAIAAGIAPFGIGTDIGGSIRIPAHFCGLVGFKPTLDRWSNRGSIGPIKGQELVRSQIGCLSRHTDDVALLWRALDPIEQGLSDPLVAPVPATEPAEVDVSALTIGFVEGDPFFEPTASIRRVMKRARKALEDAGAKVVMHRPVSSGDVIYLWLSAISADGGRSIDSALAGEAPSPQVKPSRQILGLPRIARRSLSAVIGLFGQNRASKLLDTLGEKRVDEVWQLTQERTELRLREFDSWRQQGIDAIICPPHVTPALSHRESGDFALSLGSMMRWTLLNFPAGIVPVSTVTRADTSAQEATGDLIEKKAAQIAKDSLGLPVGVQVVAPPYMEHVLLSVMSSIEQAVRGDDGFPATPIDPKP